MASCIASRLLLVLSSSPGALQLKEGHVCVRVRRLYTFEVRSAWFACSVLYANKSAAAEQKVSATILRYQRFDIVLRPGIITRWMTDCGRPPRERPSETRLDRIESIAEQGIFHARPPTVRHDNRDTLHADDLRRWYRVAGPVPVRLPEVCRDLPPGVSLKYVLPGNLYGMFLQDLL